MKLQLSMHCSIVSREKKIGENDDEEKSVVHCRDATTKARKNVCCGHALHASYLHDLFKDMN